MEAGVLQYSLPEGRQERGQRLRYSTPRSGCASNDGRSAPNHLASGIPAGFFRFPADIFLLEQFPEFLHESTDILKFTVYRGKADIGDRIQAVDALDHQLSDLGAGDFLFLAVKNLLFNLIDNTLDLVYADRAFVAGSEDPTLDLGPVIGLSVVVLFDHDHGDRLNLLISRESALARITNPSSTDRIVFLHRSGIRHSGIFTSTIRTLHFFSPFQKFGQLPRQNFFVSI